MTRRISKAGLGACLLLAACVGQAAPQEPKASTEPRRPRVGVALAGGGARGFAHIGFLKWLERNRIPVDAISGTSMGALVGAAYAAGKSPEQIEQLFEGMDWEAVLAGKAAYSHLSYRRKEDDRVFPNAIEFGFRKKTLTLPQGLVSNHAVGLVIDRLLLPYGPLGSFDELPIPFRCVATDLVKGEVVTFRGGSLPEALRATMAIPGVFSPVRRPGQLLVDGGILNNLPTEALLEMDVDVVIAVRLSRLPRVAEDLPVSGILDGAVDVVLETNERRSVEAARQKVRVIFLTLDVGAFTSTDFAQAAALAARGEQIEAAAAAELRQLAQETQSGWDAWQQARRARVRESHAAVRGIDVAARKEDARREIETEVARGGGEPLETERLENTLTRIYGNGRYDSLGYQLGGDASAPRLRVNAEEKFHGPPFVRLLAERTSQNLFQNEDRVAEYQTDRTLAGVDVGYRFGRKDELRSGVEIGRINAGVRVGNPLLPRLEGMMSRAFLRWSHDGHDTPIVPRTGWRVLAESSWYADAPGANGRFPQTEVHSSAFVPVDRRGSLFAIISGGTTFSEDAPPAQAFTLGGPFRLGALGLDEVRGSHFSYSALGYIREVFRSSPPFGTRVHVGAWYEVGKVFESVPQRGFYSNGSLGVVMETPLGPLFLGGSIGEEGRKKLYFKLGRFF